MCDSELIDTTLKSKVVTTAKTTTTTKITVIAKNKRYIQGKKAD